jgi:mannosyltransferase
LRPWVVFLAILAAALALRLADLGSESLWLDEGVAIRMASLPLQGTIAATASDVHPPLYRATLHEWISFMGRSERRARLLSALVGTLSVLLVWRIGIRLAGPFGGLVAAALLALSPIAIRYSQDATSYALYMFVALASYFFFLRWLERRRLFDGLGYALSTAALLYVHNTAWFTWVAQWLTFVIALPRAPRPRAELVLRWIFLQAGVIALYGPWMSVFLHQLGQVGNDFWIPRPTPRTLVSTALDLAGSPWMLAAFGVAMIAGLFAKSRAGEAPRQAWPGAPTVLVPWIIVPIAGPFVASYIFAPIFLTRVTLVALPVLGVLAARGLGAIRGPWLRAACVALVLLGLAEPLVSYYREPNKERWREAVADLEMSAAPGDLVLVNSGFCKENVVDYYLRRHDLDVVPFPDGHSAVSPADLDTLRQLIAGRHRVWLFRSHGGDGSGAIPGILAQALPRAVERDYPQVNYRWSTAPPYIGVVLARYEELPVDAPPAPAPPRVSGR